MGAATQVRIEYTTRAQPRLSGSGQGHVKRLTNFSIATIDIIYSVCESIGYQTARDDPREPSFAKCIALMVLEV